MPLVNLTRIADAWCPDALRPALDRLKNSDTGSRLARGAAWSIAGAASSKALLLAAWILVVRMLGKAGYGELGIVQSTVGMFAVFAGFSLGLTTTKHVAQFRQSDPDRAGRIIALSGLVAMVTGGLMALGLAVGAPWLAEHTLNAPHLAGVLRIGALILFISALNGAQTGALSGFEAFRTIARINLLVGLSSFPILLGGAYFGGLTGAVWALAINCGVNWLLNHIALRRETRRQSIPVNLTGCGREISVLWRFALPAVLAEAMLGPAEWICSALLVNRPHGYEEMGVLGAASQWFSVLLFLPVQLGQVVLPVLSERLGQRDTTQSMKIVVVMMKVNAIIVLPLVLIASIASPYIMSLYGEGFRNGWPTLVVVLMTIGLLSVLTPVEQVIAASGNMWVRTLMNMGCAVVFILGTLLLVDRGSLGVATARTVAYLFQTVWMLGFAWHLLAAAKAARPHSVSSGGRPENP